MIKVYNNYLYAKINSGKLLYATVVFINFVFKVCSVSATLNPKNRYNCYITYK